MEGHWLHIWSGFIVGVKRRGEVFTQPAGTIQMPAALAAAILQRFSEKVTALSGTFPVEDAD
jgi:hypothetical protein